jgi:hypothetical protein
MIMSLQRALQLLRQACMTPRRGLLTLLQAVPICFFLLGFSAVICYMNAGRYLTSCAPVVSYDQLQG